MSRRHNDRSPDTTMVYAWISRDIDGVEGIVAIPGRQGDPMALVATDEARARSLERLATLAARARGFDAHLVAFTRGETLLTVPSDPAG